LWANPSKYSIGIGNRFSRSAYFIFIDIAFTLILLRLLTGKSLSNLLASNIKGIEKYIFGCWLVLMLIVDICGHEHEELAEKSTS